MGQKEPSGWERLTWATVLKVRDVLTSIAKKRIMAKRGAGGGSVSEAFELMDEGDEESADFESTLAEFLAAVDGVVEL